MRALEFFVNHEKFTTMTAQLFLHELPERIKNLFSLSEAHYETILHIETEVVAAQEVTGNRSFAEVFRR